MGVFIVLGSKRTQWALDTALTLGKTQPKSSRVHLATYFITALMDLTPKQASQPKSLAGILTFCIFPPEGSNAPQLDIGDLELLP